MCDTYVVREGAQYFSTRRQYERNTAAELGAGSFEHLFIVC